MTITVEDGSVIADADSYVSVAEADAVLVEDIALGAEAWNALDDENKEEFLKIAARFLERRFRWYGSPIVGGQSLQWPRTKNFDDKGDIISPGVIPKQLKDAQIEVARFFTVEPEDVVTIVDGGGVPKSWGTDGLSITFDTTAVDSSKEDKGSGVLLGTRFVDLEFLLRSIGTWKDLHWLQVTKQTVVNE